MSATALEFSTEMDVERIKEQARWEQRLGRPFTIAERAIFDAGFFAGTRFGMRDTMAATERIMRSKG